MATCDLINDEICSSLILHYDTSYVLAFGVSSLTVLNLSPQKYAIRAPSVGELQ